MAEKIISVSQVNTYIKNMFDTDFLLKNLSVKGEVSNLKYHTSGHIYFTLKDEGGTLSVVMFKSLATGLKFKLNDGDLVTIKGSVTIYERDGKYQMYAKSISLFGEGDLYKRYLALKEELEDMGMFATEYKKAIKTFNKRVGVISAKTGAALQDIINVSKRRNPYVELVVCPALVQGKEAKYSIVKAIEKLDLMNLDVIIVARGGGSIEDLWAFNEECVARAVFNCNTPVISAVGHETDYTIIDFVSDLRAPTPSAGAELAVCDIFELEHKLNVYKNRLDNSILKVFNNLRNQTKNLMTRLSYLSPANKLKQKYILIDKTKDRLNSAFNNLLLEKKKSFAIICTKLSGLSPLDKLSQGYSMATNSKDKVIKSIKDIKINEEITINVSDGDIKAKVIGSDAITRK